MVFLRLVVGSLAFDAMGRILQGDKRKLWQQKPFTFSIPRRLGLCSPAKTISIAALG
jgi:hypothetical protein